jgi:ribonucleoside-diphosphate reductase alpha chain
VQQELLRQTGEYPAFDSATPVGTPVVVPVSGQGGAQSEAEEYHADNKSFIGTCPDCGSQLEFAEGCVKCHVCGFSECG